MTSVKYEPFKDIIFLIKHEYTSENDLKKLPDLEEKITKIACNLFEIEADKFKMIPLKFKIKIFSKLSETDQKQSASKDLAKFLKNDDEFASELVKNPKYKNLAENSYLVFSENGERLSIHSIKLSNEELLKMLESLDHSIKSKIKSLDISKCNGLKDLTFLNKFNNLVNLNASWNPSLTSLQGIQNCPKLESLDIHECGALRNLDRLESLPLKDLDASSCRGLEDISALSAEPSKTLKKLNLGLCNSLINFEGIIAKLLNLEVLNLRHLQLFFNLNFLHNLSKLRELDVDYTQVKDIKGIFGLKNLKTPKFIECPVPKVDYNILTSQTKNPETKAKK